MSNVITFYDIASKIPGQAWSPNTYKTRYSLNYKGIPYKTVWVEYPDIESVCKKAGIPPTTTRADGRPLYTLPAIYDPSTGAGISESALIAEYLDNTYPNTPKLFPPGTHALQFAFLEAYPRVALNSLFQFILPASGKILNPPSEKYYRLAREEESGKKFDDIVPRGQSREVEWAKVKEGFDIVDGWLQKGKANGPYFSGSSPCFADFVAVSFTLWLKKIWGEDSPEWKDIKSWNDGRWAALVDRLVEYEVIV